MARRHVLGGLAGLLALGALLAAGVQYDRMLIRAWTDRAYAAQLKEARGGLYRAQVWIGQAYAAGPLGTGWWGDPAAAERWYAEGAAHGYGPALFHQAELVVDDPIRRRGILAQAAEAQVPEALVLHAVMCLEGEGGPKDPAIVDRNLFHAARVFGNPAAQALIGQAAEAAGNFEEAARYYRAAARPMSPAEAMEWEAYEADPTIEPDSAAVVAVRQRQWAPQGDPEAQRRLARLYAEGLGVPQDPVRALAWCHMAAEQGHAEAEAIEPGYVQVAGEEGMKAADALIAEWFAGRSPKPDLVPIEL